MADLSREEYTLRYGPTTGDRVRLGDTDLWVRVEDDHVGFGDEPIWGYAKDMRLGMAQSGTRRAGSPGSAPRETPTSRTTLTL